MIRKRMTKAQREEVEFAALRKRIADVATGAAGFEFDTEDNWATAEVLSRLIPALEVLFGDDNNKYLWFPSNLNHFDRVDTICDYLWEHGVRAE